MGLPPTGKPFKFTGITILKFQDCKCIERWNEIDFLGLLQQLGQLAPALVKRLAKVAIVESK